MRLLGLVLVLLAGVWAGTAHACNVPNPNLSGPPFVDGCDVPAVALNKLANGVASANVKNYGAIGNGIADDSTAFTAAAAALCLSGGGVLNMPPTTTGYLVHDVTFTCPVLMQGAGRTAVKLDYHTAAAFGFRWQVPGFPAFKSNAHVIGGGVENILLSDGSSNATGIIVEGFQDWYAHALTFNNAYTGFFLEGDEKVDFRDITMNGTRHQNYVFYGDLTGQTALGAPCSTSNADCSTRSDFIVMHDLENIDNLLTNTGITIQGFVNDVMGDHFAFEGAATGLLVSCQAGLDPGLSQCPHFIYLNDFQNEFFSVAGINATDFVDMKLDKFYAFGNSSNLNDAMFGSINYSGSASPPGKLMVSHSMFFASQNDCVSISGTLVEASFDHNWIYGCNISNAGTGGVIVNPTTNVNQLNFDNNTFCTVNGFAGVHPPAYAVKANSGTMAATKIVHNYFFGCGNPPVILSGGGFTNMVRDNLGPNTTPVLGACGTSPALGGGDASFLLTIGGGNPSSCTVNFANTWVSQPLCVYSAASGATGIASLVTSPTSVVFNGTNEAGQYSVFCQLPP